ncbi:hypothetical protein Tco_1384782 [Tanacetum coccineum]
MSILDRFQYQFAIGFCPRMYLCIAKLPRNRSHFQTNKEDEYGACGICFSSLDAELNKFLFSNDQTALASIEYLQKIYNGKKAALKERYWVPEEDGTYDLERIRRGRPLHISEMESSATREYPSLIHTFFLTHTVGGVFLNPEDKALYDEMLRLQGLGSNTSTGVPYTEDEIMAIVRGGKQRGHIPSVGRVLPGQGTVIPPPPPCTHSSDVAKLKKSEKRLTKQVKMFMKLFRSDDKFSQMLTQLESQPEYGGGSGSGGCGDDEPGDDEDGDEDEEDG